ncbi:MAG TPA: septal ring lytic transglycosylase RlpA family protein [Gallionella sp.]|nr:septal ring lytic transglycosylase RlpA family protein [Gallionella sp.]
MSNIVAVMIITSLMLAACGTVPHRKAEAPAAAAAPGGGGYLPGDGPGKDIPVNLDSIPDAVPKVEPLHRYANRPYIALGKTYRPMMVVGNYKERGIASWYGKKFNGEKTSSGEIYDMYAMTAAHPILPLPSYARVTNLSNHKSVIVRINDRGPFMNDRIIDLSYTAAYKLGIINDGSSEVEVESINPNVTVKTIAPSSVQSQPLESSVPAAPAVATAAPAAAPATANTSNLTNAPPVAAPAAPPAAPVASTPSTPTAPVVAVAAAAVPAPATAGNPNTLNTPAAKDALGSGDSAVYLQLGAFSSQAGAEAYMDKLRSKLGDTGKQQLKLTFKDGLVRVHIGPYASLSEARSNADNMQEKIGFKPMVNLP